MIRDILVVMDSTTARAGPFALSVAAQLNAFLTAATVTTPGPFEPLLCTESRYDIIEAAQRDAIEVAQAAVDTFADQAKAAGYELETTLISGAHQAERKLLALSQTYDLIITEQPNSDGRKPADDYLEPLLLHSGRPALIVPYFYSKEPSFETITVAWDGSVPAARALADSIPLLRRARRVSVLKVLVEDPEDTKEADSRLDQHLVRHGVDAQFRALRSSLAIAETLLSDLADAGSDLLVMGAYGHSKLREVVLGGATRTILNSMTVPVFMSH